MATLEQTLTEAKKNNRVCPQPMRWNEMYGMLPVDEKNGMVERPAAPLILAALWDTPALFKMLRLAEHIEWAGAHGCLDRVYDFLHGLREDEWRHLGDIST